MKIQTKTPASFLAMSLLAITMMTPAITEAGRGGHGHHGHHGHHHHHDHHRHHHGHHHHHMDGYNGMYYQPRGYYRSYYSTPRNSLNYYSLPAYPTYGAPNVFMGYRYGGAEFILRY